MIVFDCTVQFSPNVIFEPFVELVNDLIINNDMYSNYINSTALTILTGKTVLYSIQYKN